MSNIVWRPAIYIVCVCVSIVCVIRNSYFKIYPLLEAFQETNDGPTVFTPVLGRQQRKRFTHTVGWLPSSTQFFTAVAIVGLEELAKGPGLGLQSALTEIACQRAPPLIVPTPLYLPASRVRNDIRAQTPKPGRRT